MAARTPGARQDRPLRHIASRAARAAPGSHRRSRATAAATCIFEKGDPATSLYVVFSGRIAIVGQGRATAASRCSRCSARARCSARCRCSTAGALGERPRAHDRAPHRGRVRRRARVLVRPARRAVGRRARSSPAGCARPTRRSPTRCSSTSPAAPRSGCSSSPTARTTSACRSRKRSSRAWSARRASA